MKLKIKRWGIPGALASLCLFPTLCSAANIVVGSGNDTSYLILQSTNLGIRTYEVRYNYDSGTPRSALFLLSTAAAGDPAISFGMINFGTEAAPNFYVNAISLNGTPESESFTAPWIYWAHWAAGGQGFMNPDYSFNPGTAPLDSWSAGFGISTRTIAPGSSDALYLSDGETPPSIAPIPEPASLALAATGLVLIFRRRRA